ncbi:MAG: carbohydrate-binding protein [Ferruginibacter sp.]
MKKCILLLSVFAALYTKAQTWETLSYNPNQPGLELNPLKGFATLFNPSNAFPRSVQGKLFGLDEVMTGMNNFNWTVIDNFLTQQAAAGRHSYIQVNIDPAFGESDMPPFLINQVDWEYYNGNVPDSCPNWNDPELMTAMLNFINAFGAKYNNDPRIFLVHLGLYGLWGEWHIGDVIKIRPEFEMTDYNKSLIANAFKNAFPDKFLLARYPENMPDPQQYGYSDGLFFGQSISPTNPFYFHNILKAQHADKNWMLYPVGGEIDPSLQAAIFDVSPNVVGQDIGQCLDSIRPTWLFCHHLLTSAQPATAEWDNAIRVQKAMGYTLYVDKYRVSATNGKPIIEVNVQNKGIAPLYANWDVEFAAVNAAGQLRYLGIRRNCNLNLVQPNELANYRSFFSNSTLSDGVYTFLMRVVNPLEVYSAQAKQLRFANNTQDQNLAGWLTLGQKNIVSGNAGVVPVQVTGISLTPTSHILQAGQSLQLVATVTPANATNAAITYVSDHPSTASVDANGLVITGPSFGTAIISAYTQDGGLKGTCVVTVEPARVLLPARIEAENYIRMKGITVQNCGEGGYNLAHIANKDWMEYGVIVGAAANFSVDFRVASSSGGGEISLVNQNGDTLGNVQVAATGGGQTYSKVTLNSVFLPAGSYNLRLFARKGGFNLNWIEFKNSGTLPVDLLEIRAIARNNLITVEWITGDEENNEGFNIERSIDGNVFNKIGFVAAKVISTGLNKYNFLDKNVAKNVNYYYRLVQIDKDGKLTYSTIVAARIIGNEIDSDNLVSLYPNPTSNEFKIRFNTTNLNPSLPVAATLYNVFGMIVNPKISNNGTIDITHLPVGVYFLTVHVNGKKVTKRVIKK